MDQNFATKSDFKEHYFMTKTDLKDVQSEMKDLKTEFKSDLKSLEHTLTIRLGVTFAASIGIISTLYHLSNTALIPLHTVFTLSMELFSYRKPHMV